MQYGDWAIDKYLGKLAAKGLADILINKTLLQHLDDVFDVQKINNPKL